MHQRRLMNYDSLIAFLLITLTTTANVCVNGENIDAMVSDRLCYPEGQSSMRKGCECSNYQEPSWRVGTLLVDCSYKELQTQELSETLPIYTDTIDLSWNALVKVPQFSSDTLRVLNLMHNNISALSSKNFVKVNHVVELYLSWNSIQSIAFDAFNDLTLLNVLDLSHNNLLALSLQIFKPMTALETLDLSWNRKLNYSEGVQDSDFYKTFGVNVNLRILKLDACSLANITLPIKAPLNELSLRRNFFTSMPKALPSSLLKLDMSHNLFECLQVTNNTANLSSLHTLLLEDMPRLTTIDAEAFVPYRSLQKISFVNSRRLSFLSGSAFGLNGTGVNNQNTGSTIRSLIFRGTMLRGFNSSLFPVFYNLEELDLKGMPLYCDCELAWIKNLADRLDTHGRCFKPSRLRGKPLSEVKPNEFSCSRWPEWVYGLMILFIILLTIAGIYLIVLYMRPNHGGVIMRNKVGVGSPYARVTIEPNRQEY